MKSSLTTLSFALAVGGLAVFFAQLVGARVPALLNAEHLSADFVGAVFLLAIFSDYTRPSRQPRRAVVPQTATLRADERLRLAA